MFVWSSSPNINVEMPTPLYHPFSNLLPDYR